MEFNGTVLIVDDEPHIRKYIGLILSKLGKPTIIEAATVKARLTPATQAAASTSGLRTPCGVGTTMMMSCTPATCAGMAFINTDEG